LGIASVAIPAAVIPAPSITSFAPTSGTPGTLVTISGTGFTGATAVTFNGTAGTIVTVTNSQITAVVPSAATTGPIAVTTPVGTASTSGLTPPNFTVSSVATLAPSINSFNPTSGPVGTIVTITGASFIGTLASGVQFN